MTADQNHRQPIHNRKIDINTYAYDDSAVMFEGRLTDNRFCTTYYLSGEARPPGVVHDMVVRMVVRGADLTIESIDVEMKEIPRAECIETKRSLEPIIGMKIRSGFTDQVKAEIGGAKGCTHLVALLLTMAPAAIQGAWATMARQPLDLEAFGDTAMRILENTCRVWRTDGPAINALREKTGA